MIKTEIICETCNEHFIVVSQENEPTYCSFCQTALDSTEQDDVEE